MDPDTAFITAIMATALVRPLFHEWYFRTKTQTQQLKVLYAVLAMLTITLSICIQWFCPRIGKVIKIQTINIPVENS